jgi:hypothetical protein
LIASDERIQLARDYVRGNVDGYLPLALSQRTMLVGVLMIVCL